MTIYTKKGDKGKTSLGSGVKVWKNSERVEAYGTIDELNSILGVVSSECVNIKKGYSSFLAEIIHQVQDDLFSIGSYLSNPANSNLIELLSQRTLVFEKYIDEMTEKMPELSNFILPGGGKVGALFQNARAVSRRCERNIVALSRKATINEDVLQYINRLSDLLFTMSRWANHNEKNKEIIWKRR
ncbi:MAG: cob(I)yrinic acid a,c-diamide adenosyltransferase [Candidatus Levybacteria bacterium]|nr:cob(I)yrinic acid a,c-diamide adenosyltransferase [Candidatus Levybacteria bacterium]